MAEIIFKVAAIAMLIGGIMFGLGWNSKNKERKSFGIQTIIAGAIVAFASGVVPMLTT